LGSGQLGLKAERFNDNFKLREAFMKTNLKVIAMAALFVWVSETGHAGPVGRSSLHRWDAREGLRGERQFRRGEHRGERQRHAHHHAAVDGHPAGNIVLVPSTATTGNILKGAAPFIHNFGTSNTSSE